MIVRPSRRVQRSLRDVLGGDAAALSFWKLWFEKGRGTAFGDAAGRRHRSPEPKAIPASHIKTWFGHRPSMRDGRPCIGYARASQDIIYAFGHGHIGLVGSARTGRLVAQLLSRREPEIPLKPFASDRFL